MKRFFSFSLYQFFLFAFLLNIRLFAFPISNAYAQAELPMSAESYNTHTKKVSQVERQIDLLQNKLEILKKQITKGKNRKARQIIEKKYKTTNSKLARAMNKLASLGGRPVNSQGAASSGASRREKTIPVSELQNPASRRAPSSHSAVDAEGIDFLVKQIMVEKSLAGVGLAIVRPDNSGALTIYLSGYGWADYANNVPVTVDKTQFPWASVSKTLAGLTAASLANEGRLDLDADIKSYYSAYRLPRNTRGGDYLSARLLLGHIAGVHRDCSFDYWSDTNNNTTMEPALRSCVDSPEDFISRPGASHVYSNFGINLAGVIMEKATGQDYYALAKKQILDPLGVPEIRTDFKGNSDRAKAYIKGGAEVYWDYDLNFMAAAGGLVSTVESLGKYCEGIVAGKLSSDITDLAWKDQRLSNGKTAGYGLGWFVSGDKVRHDGALPGGRNSLFLAPTEQCCIAVMSNTGTDKSGSWYWNPGELSNLLYQSGVCGGGSGGCPYSTAALRNRYCPLGNTVIQGCAADNTGVLYNECTQNNGVDRNGCEIFQYVGKSFNCPSSASCQRPLNNSINPGDWCVPRSSQTPPAFTPGPNRTPDPNGENKICPYDLKTLKDEYCIDGQYKDIRCDQDEGEVLFERCVNTLKKRSDGCYIFEYKKKTEQTCAKLEYCEKPKDPKDRTIPEKWCKLRPPTPTLTPTKVPTLISTNTPTATATPGACTSSRWHNSANGCDVNKSGNVSSIDMLQLNQWLSSNKETDLRRIPVAASGPPPYVDVNNDCFANVEDRRALEGCLNNCTPNGSSLPGVCCPGLIRDPILNICKNPPPTPMPTYTPSPVPTTSSCVSYAGFTIDRNSCCNNLIACDRYNGFFQCVTNCPIPTQPPNPTTPACIQNGSNTSGPCCSGKRCGDGYCSASCSNPTPNPTRPPNPTVTPVVCLPKCSNAPGTCCTGYRDEHGYCNGWWWEREDCRHP